MDINHGDIETQSGFVGQTVFDPACESNHFRIGFERRLLACVIQQVLDPEMSKRTSIRPWGRAYARSGVNSTADERVENSGRTGTPRVP